MEENKNCPLGKVAGKVAPDDYYDYDIVENILQIITEEKENENKRETASKIYDYVYEELRTRIALRVGEKVLGIAENDEELKKKIAKVVLDFAYEG